MAAQSVGLLLVLGFVMVALGVQLGMLSLPSATVRCGACRRRVRRDRTCPCTGVRR